MTLNVNLGNFNLILFILLTAVVVAIAAILSTPSLLHSVAVYCLVRRDAILAHRRTLANLNEEWRRQIPYPGEEDRPTESEIVRHPAPAAGR